jgi:hypothetical protein
MQSEARRAYNNSSHNRSCVSYLVFRHDCPIRRHGQRSHLCDRKRQSDSYQSSGATFLPEWLSRDSIDHGHLIGPEKTRRARCSCTMPAPLRHAEITGVRKQMTWYRKGQVKTCTDIQTHTTIGAEEDLRPTVKDKTG